MRHGLAPIRGRAVAAALALVLVSCGGDQSESDLTLDTSTLQAEVAGEPVEATKVEDAMVGEVTDDLFIGITVTPDPSGTGERVVAYICDETGDGSYLTGPREDGRMTLTHGHVSTEVELSDDGATGVVTFVGQEPQPFTASTPEGDGGLYWVRGTNDAGQDVVSTAWVVLDDGRQRGSRIEEEEEMLQA